MQVAGMFTSWDREVCVWMYPYWRMDNLHRLQWTWSSECQ